MTAYGRVLYDVRALGTSAPVRAAYEASKRSGLHAVLFGVHRSVPRIESAAVQLGNLTPLSPTARDRTLEDAKLILTDGLRVFGRRVPTGIKEPWSHDPDSGNNWPAERRWWKIDIRSEKRLGDVKYVWEAARHRDLVVLARAARLDPSGPWAANLDSLLRSWCDESEPEHGVNWYSSLELALRAIAWSQVLSLSGDQLGDAIRADMDRQLLASARHLMVELPYTMSSMKNNHMLGDALGLIILARLFPAHHASVRWGRLGERLFSAQLARHMRTDGSMIEDSLSYHRFVLEMLAARMLLGGAPAQVATALRAGTNHLVRLGVFDGQMPQYGDWDEGRVLASSGDPLDVAGSAALGLALSGGRVSPDWLDRFDELAWYAPLDLARGERELAPTRVTSVSGGIAHVSRGPWRVWFKAGAAPSHGHADLTSVWVQWNGHWLIADPGTGTYNGPIDVRTGFRTSAAHPVVRINDEDQLVPHRAFRWLHTARGHLAPPVVVAGATVFFGWHDAYERLDPSVRVGRAVLVTDSYVAVAEFMSDVGPVRLTIPLAIGVDAADAHLIVDQLSVGLFGCGDARWIRGETKPFAGWASPTYGSWQPATWLDLARAGTWGVGAQPAAREEASKGTVIGSARLRVRWTPTAAELEVIDERNGALTVVRA